TATIECSALCTPYRYHPEGALTSGVPQTAKLYENSPRTFSRPTTSPRNPLMSIIEWVSSKPPRSNSPGRGPTRCPVVSAGLAHSQRRGLDRHIDPVSFTDFVTVNLDDARLLKLNRQ